MLRQPFFWPGSLRIQFFDLHTCDWLMGRHATPEVTLHIPREVEDFPRGDKHFKHVPPPTYLIYLSLKELHG